MKMLMNFNIISVNNLVSAHHVLQVNEGVIDRHNLHAFLEAGPQHEATNTTEAEERVRGEIKYSHL